MDRIRKLSVEKNYALRDNILEYEDHLYRVVYNNDNFKIGDILPFQAVIIEAEDEEFTRHIVSMIRGHLKPQYYLKPIILWRGSRKPVPFVMELIDGTIFSLEQANTIQEAVHRVEKKQKALTYTKSLSFETQVIDKTMNFLYTRGKERLDPIPDYRSGIGYAYPILSVNFTFKDEHKVFDLLQISERDDLLIGKFFDRSYACNRCKGHYLNYREVCPKCSSSNTTSTDLVHHFPCGYIGPVEDFQFKMDRNLNCPKCNKGLHHIGVDYDKPSEVHTCHNCEHRFQDYSVKAKCFSCGHDNPVETLMSNEIRKFELTRKAASVAEDGYDVTRREFSEVDGTVKFDIFKTMVTYEIERLKQTDYNSNIAAIHMRNAGKLYSIMGDDKQKVLFKELIGQLRNQVRTTDIISFENANTIYVGMPEIPKRVAQKMIGEILDIMQKLLQKNFKGYDVSLTYNMISLDIDQTFDEQIHNLTKDLY